MNIQSWLLGSLFAGLALTAQAQDAPAAADNSAAWQQHWQQMQDYRQAWQTAKTPEERQKLQAEHWQSMQSGMGMMGGCPGMGMKGGKGMMGGGMMGAPSQEMLDMRIKYMEQMLEQMRSHRQMLNQ
ncbi:hypothetical protein YO5_00815 [Stutzerimonas stutzeri TS44]|nr:hypothetical protein YO5_00815 [Stutzerimonas stutzeri TS44]